MFPGAPDFQGTSEHANAFYEKGVSMMLLKRDWLSHGGRAGSGKKPARGPRGPGQLESGRRCALSSRRAFLSSLADPAYAPYAPYTLTALEIALVLVSRDLMIPDLHCVVDAVLVVLFLAVGWIRAVVG